MALTGGGVGGAGGLSGVFGQYVLQFFGDTKGLQLDMDKLELKATKTATHVENTFAQGFNTGVGKAREGLGSLTEVMGTSMGRLVGLVSNPLVALTALAAVGGTFAISAIRSAVDFEVAFNKVRVVLRGTGEDADSLRAKILGITPSLATVAEEVGAFANVLGVGFNPEQALRITDVAAKLSRVTGIDLNTAVHTLTDTLRAYNLTVEDTERVSDVMLGVFRKAGPEALGEFSGVVGRALPLANELGIDINQVAAAFVSMYQQGITGGRAMQALVMILSKATGEAQKFRDANVDIHEVARTRGIVGVLETIRDVSGGTIEDMRNMGIEGKTLSVMLGLSGDKAALFRENLAKIADVKLADTAATMGGIHKSIIEMKDAWEDFKVVAGEIVIPPLAAALRVAADILKEISGEKTKARGKQEPSSFLGIPVTSTDSGYEPWMVFGPESPEGQAAQERIKAAEDVAAAEQAAMRFGEGAMRAEQAMYDAIGASAARAAEAQVKSHDQVAGERRDVEEVSKSFAEASKSREELALRSITLDKQVAEARRASELELLQFDRRTIQERHRADQERRDQRLALIDVELQGFDALKMLTVEERTLRNTLAAERKRLVEEGVAAEANKEKELTVQKSKEMTARLKLEDAYFAARKTAGDATVQEEIARQQQMAQDINRTPQERMTATAEAYKLQRSAADRYMEHLRTLGIATLSDEIRYQQARVAATKEGTDERMRLEEAAFAKQKQLTQDARSGLGGLLGPVEKWAEERGLNIQTASAGTLDSMIGQWAAEQQGNMLRARAGGGASFEQWREMLAAAPLIEQWNRQSREHGGVAGMATQAFTLEPSQEASIWGLGAALPVASRVGAEADFAAAIQPIKAIPRAFEEAMTDSAKAVEDGFDHLRTVVREGNSILVQDIFTSFKGWLIREIVQELGGS